MAVQVNPPPTLRIPKAFLNDPEIKAFIKQQNAIIFQLYRRSGGTTDVLFNITVEIVENSEAIEVNAANIATNAGNISTNEGNITTNTENITTNADDIDALEAIQFDLVETGTSLTTGPFRIIDCNNTSKIEITLDPSASPKDEVHIARSGARVDIIGTVNGKTNITLNVKGFSVHLIKQITGSGWLQI